MPPDTSRAPAAASVRASDGGVLDRPPLVVPERLALRLQQRDRLGRDDVHERPTLDAREDRLVDRLGEVGPAEHEAAARSAQGLVGRRRHEVGVRERARVEPRRDEAGDVGHVDHQQGVVRPRDRGEPLEVDDPRVGARARDEELRAHLRGLHRERVVVDALVLGATPRTRGRRTSDPRSSRATRG